MIIKSISYRCNIQICCKKILRLPYFSNELESLAINTDAYFVSISHTWQSPKKQCIKGFETFTKIVPNLKPKRKNTAELTNRLQDKTNSTSDLNQFQQIII